MTNEQSKQIFKTGIDQTTILKWLDNGDYETVEGYLDMSNEEFEKLCQNESQQEFNKM